MIVQSPALVLSSLKYGESSLIIQTYTLANGAKSFIKKRAWSSKSKKGIPYFPLSEILITYNDKGKGALTSIKEDQLIYFPQNTHQNIYKGSLIFFLAEVLKDVLKEEESNLSLYKFIKSSIELLEELESDYTNLHLWFMFELTRYLGFYPSQTNSHYPFFDLENGVFSNNPSSSYLIREKKLSLFKNLFNKELDNLSSLSFNRIERQVLLDTLIQYYKLHIGEFKQPKSIGVLHQLFS